jgi:hypothetical protein
MVGLGHRTHNAPRKTGELQTVPVAKVPFAATYATGRRSMAFPKALFYFVLVAMRPQWETPGGSL